MHVFEISANPGGERGHRGTRAAGALRSERRGAALHQPGHRSRSLRADVRRVQVSTTTIDPGDATSQRVPLEPWSGDTPDVLLDTALREEVLHGVPGGVGDTHEAQHALQHVADYLRRSAQRPDLMTKKRCSDIDIRLLIFV